MHDAATIRHHFSALGERLCLDFANTSDWRASEQPVELIPTYADLVMWGRLIGVLTDEQAGQLARAGVEHPEAAEALGIGAEVGTIAPGYAADLVAVAGDPAERIEALGAVRLVVARGRLMRKEIDV